MNPSTAREIARKIPGARYALRVALLLMALPLNASAQLLWSDEFDSGSAPDPAVWSYDLGAGGWGNSELQEYTSDPSNVRVEGGYLVITALEQVLRGNRKKFSSARIRTEDKLIFTYGTIEARIKVPNLGDGLWPAFWTLGNDFSQVGWPACGELDVMEMGSAAAIADGVVNRRVSSTAHWEHEGGYAAYGLSLDAPAPLDGEFHLFRMEWTPTLISTYLDGEWIWSIDISPGSCTDCSEFHQPHFVILNMAVGGSYTGLYRSNDITAPFPAEMLVDYVRIYDNGFTQLGGSSIGGGGGTVAHVQSIQPGSSGGGPNKRANATVVIQDETGAPVGGASVTGTFSGSHNQTLTATTDATGTVTLTTDARSRTVAFEFCVDDVVKTGMTYDAASNLETCDTY